jgi:DNA polymerase-1
LEIYVKIKEITPEEYKVGIINSIQHRYPDLRQRAKGPTFALTYAGTWRTLMKNFGLTKDEAKMIEDQYHELYATADAWAQQKVREAQQKGYMELAFGLRLHTPILPRVVLNADKALPYQAQKEIKTAVNALGQSYGMLNTHAANMFMTRVWSTKWREKILPICQIHDSQYYLIVNDLNCLKWVNDNLIECMRWNKLPEIQHPDVGLEAELEVYYPSWAESVRIPNNADHETIMQLVNTLAET